MLRVPIAHGDGRYTADEATLDRLEGEGRVVFRYAGGPADADECWSPNGSMRAIAGIVNEAGNVLGMMPHPERAIDPLLGSADGLGVFESVLARVAVMRRSHMRSLITVVASPPPPRSPLKHGRHDRSRHDARAGRRQARRAALGADARRLTRTCSTRNGCEKKCGMNDLVVLDSGKVVDAVFRSSDRKYTGTSSSPHMITEPEARKARSARLRSRSPAPQDAARTKPHRLLR